VFECPFDSPRFFRANGVDVLTHGFDFAFQFPFVFLQRFEPVPLHRSSGSRRPPVTACAEFIEKLTEILKGELVQ
jgi:hypothetical protein